jgi:hypothetical protein
MALTSPGVEVTIIDQSQYLPAPLGTIPFVLLATASNKADPTSTGVAVGTTAANAGKLFEVTSQRDLVTLYGNPFFYTTSNGTPIQGYELNEYGLLAAYSALGASNRLYCLRADIDLASLVGQTGRPTGNPADGTWWLDTTSTTWGIYVFSSTTGQFSLQTPIVVSDSTLLTGGYPVQSLGVVGNYAVNAVPTYDYPSASTAKQFFYKNESNEWVALGGADWLAAVPTIQGTNSNPELTEGDDLTIALNGVSYTVTVQASPDNTVAQMSSDINALQLTYLSATVESGKLVIYSKQTGSSNGNWVRGISLSGTNNILSDLGIASGVHYQPRLVYGTSSQQPLWQAGQTYPMPTGSIWIKVGSAGSGFNPVISVWDSLLATWVGKTPSFAVSDVAATASLDSTGGKNIPAGTVYAQYGLGTSFGANVPGASTSPIYYWERVATGPTVVTGNVQDPSFTSGPYTATVSVSVPGSTSLSGPYTVTLADNTDGMDFVDAWVNAGIPYTTAVLLDTGEIQITHTQGGEIIVNDYNSTTNQPTGLMSDAGFTPNDTLNVKYGSFSFRSLNSVQTGTTGSGSGLSVSVLNYYQNYYLSNTSFVSGGSGYIVGEEVTFSGANLGGTSPANNLVVRVEAINNPGTGVVTAISFVSGTGAASYTTQLSNWVSFDMTANEGAPTASPADMTNWFYSVVDEVDIMVNTSTGWRGYRLVAYSNSGFPLPSGVNTTDPNGPIVSATQPTLQSDGTALSYGDIWIDTADLENYPLIHRYELVNGENSWVRLDNTDQTSSTGVLFADARWATSQYVSPVNDPIPTIKSLLSSSYLDLDAPDPTLYPVGMLLFNTRRSGYNVKQYRSNYFNATRFPDETLPNQKDTWLTVSGLQSNGSPYMGRKAQRAMVVQAMRAVIDTNTAIRDEDNAFNLIAAPNYPELQPNMIVLNNDRGQTGFIIGDTPMRLPDDATAIQAWATNAAGATSTGEDGLVSRDTYMGLFYPSGITSDLSGNLVAVPPSHMMIRTILRSDNVSYPWFAPAGTRRGIIDNAASIGYIDPVTGEFQVIKTRIGIRDVLYSNQINPLVFFTGNGLLNYGNKSSYNSSSALDRVNVARLVAYVRRQLTIAARPFVFEPNDALTRQQIAGVIQTLFVDLVAKRGVYDYLVVCDLSNNTPARIDRNELWVDVAFEPVKAVEFIYIPVRILNTGELGNK